MAVQGQPGGDVAGAGAPGRGPLRVLDAAAVPLGELLCLSASTRGRPEVLRIPILRLAAEGLPPGLGGLLVTSDLQGVAPSDVAGGAARPAGEALAELLAGLEAEARLPSLDTLGVLLAGDLFSDPAAGRRGATGDVRGVWRALAQCCRWVAGVAGNHDLFGATQRDRERFSREPGIHLLDGEVVALDGLRVGGVSGVIGPPGRPNRRDEAVQRAALGEVVSAGVDVLVLHEGPDGGPGRPGHAAVGQALRDGRAPLVVCGHVHWPAPLGAGPEGGQLLNAAERVLLLTPAG